MYAQEIPVFMDSDVCSPACIQTILDQQDQEFEKDFRAIATELRGQSMQRQDVKELYQDLLEVRRDHFQQRQAH